MKKTQRNRVILGILLLAAATVATSYYYPGWSKLQYFAADAQTRESLDTEQLERGYRDAAHRFDQELRTLPGDKDIRAAIDDYNSVITDARQKAAQIQKDVTDEANDFLVKHSRAPISLDSLHLEKIGADSFAIKGIRIDSVSDKPKSIRPDPGDLLQRYHADVSVTVVIDNGNDQHVPSSYTFIAAADPAKRWTFPSTDNVKQRILAELQKTRRDVQSTVDLNLNEIKQTLETQLHQMELRLMTESPR